MVLYGLEHYWEKWKIEKKFTKKWNSGKKLQRGRLSHKEAAQRRGEWLKHCAHTLHVLFIFSLSRVSIGELII